MSRHSAISAPTVSWVRVVCVITISAIRRRKVPVAGQLVHAVLAQSGRLQADNEDAQNRAPELHEHVDEALKPVAFPQDHESQRDGRVDVARACVGGHVDQCGDGQTEPESGDQHGVRVVIQAEIRPGVERCQLRAECMSVTEGEVGCTGLSVCLRMDICVDTHSNCGSHITCVESAR